MNRNSLAIPLPLSLSHRERIKSRRKTGTFARNPEFLSLTKIAPFRARVRNRSKHEKQQRGKNREDSISWQGEGRNIPAPVFFLPSRSIRRRQGWLSPLLSDGVRSWIAAGANCDYGFRVSPADFTSESRVAHPLPSSTLHNHSPPFEPFPHCPVFAARLKNECRTIEPLDNFWSNDRFEIQLVNQRGLKISSRVYINDRMIADRSIRNRGMDRFDDGMAPLLG